MCRYGTPWRKRTRIVNNTALAGRRELCCGGHSHQVLRGRSALHGVCWTRVAQVYPELFAKRLAAAVGRAAKLTSADRSSLDIAACAKCGEGRIGEAAHPGPRRRAPQARRDPRELLAAPLVGRNTRGLQKKVWEKFEHWLDDTLSAEARAQAFLCAPLAVQLLRRYGMHLYETGGRLYELRHLLVVAQQTFPLMRAAMAPAWQLVTQWEELQPVCHRKPLPEVLYKALVLETICRCCDAGNGRHRADWRSAIRPT